MDKILGTLKGLLQKGNALLGKLPFKGLAEKYIPAGAKAKVPFLETIVTPYANQIVAGLAALLLVTAIGGGGGGGGSGSSLKGSTWDSGRVENFGFYLGNIVPPDKTQTVYSFDADTVTRTYSEYNRSGNRTNQSSKTGTYTLASNVVTMTFDDGIVEGTIEGSTLAIEGRNYNGNIVFKYDPRQLVNKKTSKSEADYAVKLTDDNAGVIIQRYTNPASRVTVPAKIQGLPVIEIAEGAFKNNKAVTSVIVPEGITKIGSEAFRDCSNLESVSLPGTLTSIGRYAFAGCGSMKSIKLPAGLTELGSYAFSKSGLTSFPDPWPKAITVIPYRAFDETNIRTLVIPEGITVIDSYAFDGCKNLASVTLPSTLTRVSGNAFEDCSNLDLASQAKLREFWGR